MAIPPLVLRIYADSSGVRAGVAQTQRQVGGLRNAISRNAALMKVAIIGGVVVGLKASVDAAREAQRAQLLLQNSIQNSKVVSMDAAAAFTAQADALRDLTGIDDEAITGAQAFLVQMGLTADQVKELTPLVVDLSDKMGVDLITAAKAVGKSVNGTTSGLQRMGVVVDKTKAQTDAYGATLDALGVAQGFAARQAKNEPWRVLGAQMEEIGEKVGNLLLPALRALANFLIKAIATVKEWAKVLDAQVGPAIRDAWHEVQKLTEQLGPLFEDLKPITKLLGGAFVNNLRATALSIKIVAQWVGFLVEQLRTLISWITAAINKLDELGSKVPGGSIFPPGSGIGLIGRLLGFQAGGYAAAGTPMLVGEHGPELWVPSVSGTVLPSSQTGTGGVSIVINGDVTDPDRFARKVEQALNRAAARH